MVTDPLPGELKYLQTSLPLSSLCCEMKVFVYRQYTTIKMKTPHLLQGRNFPTRFLTRAELLLQMEPALSSLNTSPVSETDSLKKGGGGI